jgi:hypothetical protein
MDNLFNLPKYILTNYKYENNHIGLCFFTLTIKKIWSNKWCACYINQSRGDSYCRYLQSYVDTSENKVKRQLFKWVQEHQNEFKLII